MNYWWLSCWLDQRITTTVLGSLLACLVGALPVLMLCSNWVTQDLLRQSLRQSTFCFSSCCFVRWSKFLEDERGQRVRRREGLRPDGYGDDGANAKRRACFDYTSPTQIERCHARMRRFSNAATDQSQNRQMNTCSHKHTERVLAYGAPPHPPHPQRSPSSFSFECSHLEKLRPWLSRNYQKTSGSSLRLLNEIELY